MDATSRPQSSPPPHVVAHRIDASDDEFVVFSWDAAPADVRVSPSLSHVLSLLQQGYSNRDIAHKRGTSERTIANQVARLLKEFDAGSRFELMARLGPPTAGLQRP